MCALRRLILIAILLLGISACAHVPEALQAQRPASQTLIIALDAVPYSLMKELYDEGYFAGFSEPTKVITTFPSVSSAGFSGMFTAVGATRSPGYDDRHFSYEKKKAQGSLWSPHRWGPNEFQAHFEFYRGTTWQLIVMYTFPGFSGYRDLKRLRRIIWTQPTKNFYAIHIGGTDGAGHVLGRKRVKHWIIFMKDFLDRLERDYREEFHRDLKTVLFSDHGFHYYPVKGISNARLVHHLRKEGFTLSNNLYKERHVVPIALGNVSGAAFYVYPPYVEQIAQLLIEQKGMDLVTYRNEDEIIILSSRNGGERALLLAQGAEDKIRFAYRAITGDPLFYEPVITELRAHGQLDRDGFARDRDWFKLTADHHYPDALYRIYQAFNGLVENTAPIICSTDPGYEYGGTWTRFAANLGGGLKGTHGGLFQETSAAFVMENDPNIELPAVLRYSDLMRYFFPHGLKWPVTGHKHR